MTAIYGNLLAAFEPDANRRHALQTRIEAEWPSATLTEPADGWLLATDDIGPAGRILVTEHDGWTVAFAELTVPEDRIGAAVDDLTTDARIPNGEVTGVAIHRDGRIRAVRSCGGSVPVYLTARNGSAAVATMMELLTRFAVPNPRWNVDVLSIWIAGFAVFPDRQTWIEDVSCLAPGHRADRTENEWSMQRYWDPRPAAPPKLSRANAQRTQQMLRDAVVARLEQTLDPAGGNLITFSGGIDSSIVAWVSAGTVGRPVMTLTFKNGGDAEQPYRAVVEDFGRRFGVKRQWHFGVSNTERLSYLEGAMPSAVPSMHPVLCLLPHLANEERITVLAGGEFGDQVGGGGTWLRDFAEQTSTRDLLARAGAVPHGLRGMALWAKWHALRNKPPWLPLQPWVDPLFHPKVHQAVARFAAAYTVPGLGGSWRHLWASLDLVEGVPSINWEISSKLRILRVFPFCGREQFQAIFQTHPADAFGSATKAMIRSAFAQDVPAEVLAMPKYTTQKGPDEAFAQVRASERVLDLISDAGRSTSRFPSYAAMPIRMLEKMDAAAAGGASLPLFP